MNLHEYQGKEIFARYGIPVPEGILAKSPEAARAAAKTLGGRVVVKAQVHAGGRGKAGGVKLVNDADAAEEAAKKMLGTRLVTKQNAPDGQPVNSVWVEKPSNIDRELYVSGLVDRSKERFVFMASAAGGMDIEEVAAHTPEKIRHITITINPAAGLQPYQARQLGFFMGLKKDQVDQFSKILFGLYRIVTDLDAALIEINPLIVHRGVDQHHQPAGAVGRQGSPLPGRRAGRSAGALRVAQGVAQLHLPLSAGSSARGGGDALRCGGGVRGGGARRMGGAHE